MSAHTPIPGFPGYAVDIDGEIWSVGHNWRGLGSRRLFPIADEDGYLRVRLSVGGKRVKVAAHVLVATTLIGPKPSPLHEVRHLNGCRIDNHPTNLRWGTSKENADDREAHGTTSRGDRHAAAVIAGIPRALTRSQRTQIANLAKSKPTQREIARMVGCSQSAVGAQLRGGS